MSSVLNEQCVFTLAEVVSNTELRCRCFVMDKDGKLFNFSGFYMDGTVGLKDVVKRKSYHLAPSDFNNYLAFKKTSEVSTYDGVYLLKNKNGTVDILFWYNTTLQYIRLPSNKKVISAIYLNEGMFEDYSLLRIRTQDSVFYIRIFSSYALRTTCPSEKYINGLMALRLLKKANNNINLDLEPKNTLRHMINTRLDSPSYAYLPSTYYFIKKEIK